MKLVDIKVKFLFEEIFKGVNPKYVENPNDFIIFGQRNNTKSEGVSFDNCKFSEESFWLSRSEKEFLKYGDILINSLGGGTCGRVGYFNITDKKILTDGIPYVLRTKNNSKYLYYCLKINQENFEQLSIGATNQVSLIATDLINYKLKIIKDINEQSKIVNFIDEKCDEIDNAIKKTKETIEDYKKYKDAIIVSLVTRGENHTLKKTNIDWIKEIPNDWKELKISQIFYQVKKKNKGMIEQNLLSLSYGKIVKRNIDANTGLLPDNFEGYNIIQNGDIVLRLTDLQNDHKSLRVGLCNEKGIITSAYITLRLKDNYIPNYFYYLLHSFDIKKGFYGMGSGVRQGLNWEELKDLRIPVPTKKEQNMISNILDRLCKNIDELIENKEKIVKELELYKKSVIYEYVTGKKEVK